PTKLAAGISQAAVLKRASYKDVLVYKKEEDLETIGFIKGNWTTGNQPVLLNDPAFTIATSSIRRMAQWLHRFPGHSIENLRGNVNTRLRKVEEHNWNGAIFAAAGLERINLRPSNSVDLDWMLPAPAQGAIMVVCRSNDQFSLNSCISFHDADTAICTKIERDFLSALSGGCSTPISALAEIINEEIHFHANIASINGSDIAEITMKFAIHEASQSGFRAANEILMNGGTAIMQGIRNKELS
ncbi:MAG TPA: hydroxymethylbilane synthase, partial [Flavisolibacter sp.]|nr:hydroxymethylbilane synthase [Flavisolibacter sp.]